MPDEILIAGLGTVGSSIAGSLRHAKLAVGLVGYDPQPKVARAALKAQVVDRLIGDLDDVPAECDLCILSLPPGEMIPALESLAPRLAEGALVLSTSPVQSPIMAWCAEHLPAGRSYVGAVPVEGASVVAEEPEAVFRARTILPAGSWPWSCRVGRRNRRSTSPRAWRASWGPVRSSSIQPNLTLPRRRPIGLPILLAAALMNMSTRQPGWRNRAG